MLWFDFDRRSLVVEGEGEGPLEFVEEEAATLRFDDEVARERVFFPFSRGTDVLRFDDDRARLRGNEGGFDLSEGVPTGGEEVGESPKGSRETSLSSGRVREKVATVGDSSTLMRALLESFEFESLVAASLFLFPWKK